MKGSQTISSNKIMKKKIKPHSFTVQKTSSGFTKVQTNTKEIGNSIVQLRYQFNLLTQIFPTVSSKTLRILLLAEDGQSLTVAKNLLTDGNDYLRVDLIELLTDEPSPCLDCQFYWGKLKPSYITILRESPPGSYFTALNECDKFVICFKSKSCHRSYVETIFSPNNVFAHKNQHFLSNPMPRPLYVTNNDLVPGLKKSRFVKRCH